MREFRKRVETIPFKTDSMLELKLTYLHISAYSVENWTPNYKAHIYLCPKSRMTHKFRDKRKSRRIMDSISRYFLPLAYTLQLLLFFLVITYLCRISFQNHLYDPSSFPVYVVFFLLCILIQKHSFSVHFPTDDLPSINIIRPRVYLFFLCNFLCTFRCPFSPRFLWVTCSFFPSRKTVFN